MNTWNCSETLNRKIEEANKEAFRRMSSADLYWLDWLPVLSAVPGIGKNIILKSGPPAPWEKLTPTQQQGVINGALFEKLAATREEAERKILNGEIEVRSGNEFGIVCSGTGIVTPSMSVNVVENRNTGKRGFCAPFEGPNRGGLAGYGMFNEEIGKYLDKMNSLIVPVFSRILRECGGISLNPFLSQGLAMGDELHIRQDAATLMITRDLLFRVIDSSFITSEERDACFEYLRISPRIFHPLDMAAAMAVLQGIRGIEFSTVVSGLCGNGVEFGIQLAAMNCEWFTAPAPEIKGKSPASAKSLPWIGDSCACEGVGWGAFASAASPLSEQMAGHSPQEAVEQTEKMYLITSGENPLYPLIQLNGRGTPCGIDARKVCETGVLPVLHGGRMALNGERLGAGLAKIPLACFEKAKEFFIQKYQEI